MATETRSLLAVFDLFFANLDTPEWMILEQSDDCEELSKFLTIQKWTFFFLGKDYLEFVDKYPKRFIMI